MEYEYEYHLELKVCPCCHGTGIQYCEKDGLKHLCPACRGKGKVRKRE